MTQHYLCFHSIRTQPFIREPCITYLFSLSSTCCVLPLVISRVFRFRLLFATLLSSTRNLVYHRLPYPFTLSSIPSLLPVSSISIYSATGHELFPYCVYFPPITHSLRLSRSSTDINQRLLVPAYHASFLYIPIFMTYLTYSECILTACFFTLNRMG